MIFSISGSNSATERSFSKLTLLLTDRRTKIAHDTIRMLLSIKINDHLWSEQERDNIILEAVDLYMSAPRKKQVDTLETSRQEKLNKPPLIEIDSDDDNESEVDFKKDIESDKDMEQIKHCFSRISYVTLSVIFILMHQLFNNNK